jgi:hypothetical protein
MNEKNAEIYLDTRLLDFLVKRGEAFETALEGVLRLGAVATNVRGLQEIVYRYHLLGETALGYQRAKLLRGKARVLPVEAADLDILDELLDRYPCVPPRELLHAASMLRHGIRRIACSPDTSYRELSTCEVLPVLSRLTPRI